MSFPSNYEHREWDDRPERELGWILNPAAPLNEIDVEELLRDIASSLEGRTAQ